MTVNNNPCRLLGELLTGREYASPLYSAVLSARSVAGVHRAPINFSRQPDVLCCITTATSRQGGISWMNSSGFQLILKKKGGDSGFYFDRRSMETSVDANEVQQQTQGTTQSAETRKSWAIWAAPTETLRRPRNSRDEGSVSSGP